MLAVLQSAGAAVKSPRCGGENRSGFNVLFVFDSIYCSISYADLLVTSVGSPSAADDVVDDTESVALRALMAELVLTDANPLDCY